MKRTVKTNLAPAAVGAYSQGLMVHDMLFVSGQLPLDPETGEMAEDTEAQATRSMENVKAIVEGAGLTMGNVIKTTILLKDISDFGVVNQVYSQYFETDCPARACYAVKDIPKGAKLEIEAIAVK